MNYLPKKRLLLIISWLVFISALYFFIGRKIHIRPTGGYIAGVFCLAALVVTTLFIKEKALQKIHVLLLIGILAPIVVSLIALALLDIAPLVFAILALLGAIAGAIITAIVFVKSIGYLMNIVNKK